MQFKLLVNINNSPKKFNKYIYIDICDLYASINTKLICTINGHI